MSTSPDTAEHAVVQKRRQAATALADQAARFAADAELARLNGGDALARRLDRDALDRAVCAGIMDGRADYAASVLDRPVSA